MCRYRRLIVAIIIGLSVTPGVATVQIELDRIVSRVAGRLITQSDVRQARVLRLVDDAGSDEAAQRALETRLLILHELNRAAPLAAASAPEIDQRRSEWAASVGGEAQVSDLMRAGGMSEADLEAWLGDDLRIRAYLRRQFGMLGDAERTQAMHDWLARLRQRADLPP